ncbi:MAG: peptidylprolyl isomerase [Gammaproteobacteria bacterium]|jgi:hypothetical protein|nr:peptidylprolyl isomerase [Gammaproteobacteria bacterium]
MTSFFRQPLVWFLCLSGALFIADAGTSDQTESLVVTPAVRARIALLWETQMGTEPSASELESLIAGWIEEEVLYREALRLGLDREDSIIRRRLVQKLNFIAESDPVTEPEDATLLAFYNDNLEDFILPERLTFRQLTFRQEASAQAALVALSSGADAATLGESTMLNRAYSYRSALDINSTFGMGFASRLDKALVGTWQGPVKSSFGFHLVLLTGVEPEQATPFSAARSKVISDYQQANKQHARQRYLENLINNTEIRIE